MSYDYDRMTNEELNELCDKYLLGADGVDIRFDPDVITEGFVRAVKAAGFELHVWTIDDLERAKLAFARGAQTVTTNCAKKLLDQYQGK